MNTNSPRIVCIIGMHRSGTSMITQLLSLCGLALGPAEHIMKAAEFNPQGHFENELIRQLNDDLLAHFGGAWNSPSTQMPENWPFDPALKSLVEQAREIVRLFPTDTVWGWKDPRTSLLLPFWQSIVPNLSYVICIRSPLAVARSLTRRDRIPPEQGARLWYHYMNTAIHHTAGQPRIFASYEDFFQEPIAQIARLAEFCKLDLPENVTPLTDAIKPHLNHTSDNSVDLLRNSNIGTTCKLFYFGLRSATADTFLNTVQQSDSIRNVSERVDRYVNLFEAHHNGQAVNQLEAALAEQAVTIQETQAELHRYQQALVQKEGQVTELQLRLPDHDNLTALYQTTKHKDEQIDQLAAVIEEHKTVLAHRDERITALLIAQGELQSTANQLHDTLDTQKETIAQKNTQINEATAHQTLLENSLETLQAQLQVQTDQLSQTQQALATERSRFAQQEEAFHEVIDQQSAMQGTLETLQADLLHKQSTLQKQTETLATNKAQIQNLARHNEALTQQVQALQDAQHHKQKHVDDLIAYQIEQDHELQKAKLDAQQKKGHLDQLQSLLQDREQHIETILQSRGGRILNGYWQFADWLAPLDTNRRTIVEWFLNVSSLRTPKKKVSDILENQVKVQSTSSDRLPLVPNSYQEAIGVSVIVPTKNGGNQFQHQLTMLQKQQGLQDIELIIVDSGSTDGTPEIAEQFGAKVIRIQPEAFSHSYARNLGADHATNPYLLFTVQDALPPSEQWLFDLVSIVQNTPDVVAASCAEYPRADADLFYRVVSWGHYQFLGTNSQDRIVGQPSDTSHESLRKNGNLSDVACLIEREIFLQYRYRGDYAEDLDLGIRLIQDDYKLALLGSIRVIHSHNRPAYYHLRRGYVDEQQLTKILPNRPCLAHDTNRLLRDIVFIYGLIDKLITQDLAHIPLPCKTPHLAKTVLDRMNLGRQDVFVKSSALPQTSYVDNQLAVFMETVYQQHYDVCLNGANQQRYDGILLDAMLEFMQTIFTYMRNTYEWIDEVILDDFKYSLYKGFAFQTGVHLSSCYTQDIGDARSVLNTINHELVQGV